MPTFNIKTGLIENKKSMVRCLMYPSNTWYFHAQEKTAFLKGELRTLTNHMSPLSMALPLAKSAGLLAFMCQIKLRGKQLPAGKLRGFFVNVCWNTLRLGYLLKATVDVKSSTLHIIGQIISYAQTKVLKV